MHSGTGCHTIVKRGVIPIVEQGVMPIVERGVIPIVEWGFICIVLSAIFYNLQIHQEKNHPS